MPGFPYNKFKSSDLLQKFVTVKYSLKQQQLKWISDRLQLTGILADEMFTQKKEKFLSKWIQKVINVCKVSSPISLTKQASKKLEFTIF